MPGHVDQGRHRAGQDALWDECCRLRALLRQGHDLVDQLECLAVPTYPALYGQGKEWRRQVREELRT